MQLVKVVQAEAEVLSENHRQCESAIISVRVHLQDENEYSQRKVIWLHIVSPWYYGMNKKWKRLSFVRIKPQWKYIEQMMDNWSVCMLNQIAFLLLMSTFLINIFEMWKKKIQR